MGYAAILGLDLGKFKSVCCAMEAGSGAKGAPHTPSACGRARRPRLTNCGLVSFRSAMQRMRRRAPFSSG
jgi:hypothetical protein